MLQGCVPVPRHLWHTVFALARGLVADLRWGANLDMVDVRYIDEDDEDAKDEEDNEEEGTAKANPRVSKRMADLAFLGSDSESD